MSGQVKARRLESLDILRGLNMFMIEGGDLLLISIAVLFGFPKDCAFAQQFEHVAWHGFHFEDFIYPLFVFISGVTWPFSHAKLVERGATGGQIAWKIVRRAMLLVALGLFYSKFLTYGFHKFQWASVIGRIGICWGIAAAVYAFTSMRTRIVVFWGILLSYWLLLVNVPAPGSPPGADPLAWETCLVTWINPYIINIKDQFAFSVYAMAATALAGMFAGSWLRYRPEGLSELRRTLALAGAGAVAIAVGLVWACGLGRWSFPLNKILWSSSLVLVAGGISAILLALFHWIVDVKGYARWGFFFKVIGMNAILLYVASRSVISFRHVSEFVFGGVASLCSPDWSAFILTAGMIASYWLLLYFLYRKNIFLKV